MSVTRIRAFRAGLIQTDRPSGAWSLDATDVLALERAIGPALLKEFMRCFVWADRLASLAHLAYLSEREGRETITFSRDLQFMVWSASGCLFEAADAVMELEKAGVASRLSNSADWNALRSIGDRWLNDKRLRRLRNNIGFHVDAKFMGEGINAAARDGDRITLMSGDDGSMGHSTLRAGLEFLLKGMGWTLADYSALIVIVRDDHMAFSLLVQKVMKDVMRTAGVVE